MSECYYDRFSPCFGCGDCEDNGGIRFADPGGNSALRASSPSNPRNLPCPTCEAANRLTPADVEAGYHCDSCADRIERGESPWGEY